jgi:hypothetical protein
MTIETVNSATFVRQAYSFVGIINQNDDLPDNMYQDGIDYLNQILGADQASGINIPYYVAYTLNTVNGQAAYTISTDSEADLVENPLIELEMAQVIFNNTQYPIYIKTREEFFDTARSLIAYSMPREMILVPGVNTSQVQFYPAPNNVYQVIIRGKAALSNITKNTDMSNIPPHMLKYLRYALGRELSLRYKSSVWDERAETEFLYLREQFNAGNDVDIAIQKAPSLRGSTFMWPMSSNIPPF